MSEISIRTRRRTFTAFTKVCAVALEYLLPLSNANCTMMKRFVSVLAFSLVALSGSAQAARSAPAEITVTGQGTVTQKPDLAFLNATVTTSDAAAQNATAKNQRAYDALVAAMKKLGVAESDVRTDDINVSFNPPPRPEPDSKDVPVIVQPQSSEMYGYIANRGVTVTLHDTALAGKALDAAVRAGVTNIGGVSFGASQSQSAYNQATRLAVDDARRQARAMASAAGLRITGIKTMQQGMLAQSPSPVPFAKVAMAAVNTRIPPNDVHVYATVTITYEAIP